jgi:hypothetical protein
MQAMSRTQPVLLMWVGQLERRTHDYKRHDVTSLFAALDVARGNVLGKCNPRHRSVESLDFLKKIDTAVPPDIDLHLVPDNYSTHKIALVRQWLQKRPRYCLHFTPNTCFMAQSGRMLVRAAYPEADHAWIIPQCLGTGSCHPRVHRRTQPATKTLLLDQVCRSNPGFDCTLRYRHPRLFNHQLIMQKSMTQEI